MSDNFEQELRDHLRREASQVNEFPKALASRIREDIAPHRRRFGATAQLAVAGGLALLAILVLYSLQHMRLVTNQPAGDTISPTTGAFQCSDQTRSTQGGSAQLTGIQTSAEAGFDRLVFQFAGAIPPYDLTRQSSTTFFKDASGAPAIAEGSAGLHVAFRDSDLALELARDRRPSLPVIREIKWLGAFERVVSYGVGLSTPACLRVQELSNPPRLVIEFSRTMESAAPSPSMAPSQPTENLGPFACTDRSVAPRPGVTAGLTRVRYAPQPGYDRVVFEFDSSRVPVYEVTQQGSAQFVRDASGQPVTLKGSAGVRVVLRGATAMTYSDSRDITTGLPMTEQLVQLGDFEGVTTWGIGLARAACFRVLELSNPTRLVIDFQSASP